MCKLVRWLDGTELFTWPNEVFHLDFVAQTLQQAYVKPLLSFHCFFTASWSLVCSGGSPNLINCYEQLVKWGKKLVKSRLKRSKYLKHPFIVASGQLWANAATIMHTASSSLKGRGRYFKHIQKRCSQSAVYIMQLQTVIIQNDQFWSHLMEFVTSSLREHLQRFLTNYVWNSYPSVNFANRRPRVSQNRVQPCIYPSSGFPV